MAWPAISVSDPPEQRPGPVGWVLEPLPSPGPSLSGLGGSHTWLLFQDSQPQSIPAQARQRLLPTLNCRLSTKGMPSLQRPPGEAPCPGIHVGLGG